MNQNFSSSDMQQQLQTNQCSQKKVEVNGKAKKMRKIDNIVFLLVVCIGILSYIYYEQIKDYLFFNNCKINNVEDQIELGIQFLLYFCIINMINWALGLMMQICGSGSSRYCARRSLERFVIFIGMSLFFVNRELISVNEKYFAIAVNWFLLSEGLQMIGIVLDDTLQVNIRHAGAILMTPITLLAISRVVKNNEFLSF